MKTTETIISKLNNGDRFYIGIMEYRFVGKSVYQKEETDKESYVACDQDNGNLVSFSALQPVRIPRPKPVRTDFWYKKKFVELVYRTMEYRKVEVMFNKVRSHLNDTIHSGCGGKCGAGATLELGGDYCRSNYIITTNYKTWDGVTIMLINTVTGKSVSCKHIDPDKVNINNVYLIIFDLYKKYMNQ